MKVSSSGIGQNYWEGWRHREVRGGPRCHGRGHPRRPGSLACHRGPQPRAPERGGRKRQPQRGSYQFEFN